MKTCRNLLAAAVVAVFVTGCIPPLTTLRVATTGSTTTPGFFVTVNAGQQVDLSWTGTTLMPYSNGQALMQPRDYKITPSDPYASPLTIAENCGGADWPCLRTGRSGTLTVNPYVSGTYTLTADETVGALLPPAPLQTFSARPARVTVTVNQDVLISDVIGYVTDSKLRGCITALGLTRVNEVTNLSCVGVDFPLSKIQTLAGLEYFYALQTLDITNNLLGLDTAHGMAPRYMANPQVVTLYRSGLNCTRQNEIEAALVAKNPTVLVNKGVSSTNLCP